MMTMTAMPNKSLQATRDGVSSSAIADDVICPACLIWTLGHSALSTDSVDIFMKSIMMPV
jgi:hypothetical protein